MTIPAKSERMKTTRPFCQTAGCFEQAEVYVVLKEMEVEEYCAKGTYSEVCAKSNFAPQDRSFENEEKSLAFDGFKLILYLCSRHDNDLHYLLTGSELHISKRCYLEAAAGLRRVQPSSK
jgi:hypothetical protein